MNCMKCPIAEECEVSKKAENHVTIGEDTIPTRISPHRKEECPLLQALETAKSQGKT